MKKRIAVLCNYRILSNRVGGMDHFFWMFDAACKNLDHEIIWFFPNDEVYGTYQQMNIMAAHNKTIEESFLNYCHQHQLVFDTLITHFVELCTPFFREVKKEMPVKIIAVDHNPRPLKGYPLKKQIMKKINGIIFSRYIDVFVGVSQYTCKELIKDFGGRIQKKTLVIYNGIEHQLYQKRKQRNKENPAFLVASHLRFSKGIQDLIAAVALLPEIFKNKIKIDIYGEGPYKVDLIAQINLLKVENCFVFKGSVPNLFNIYGNYDYLIQPTYMECFSLSILESLSANVPVITTSVGGNEEIIQHGKNGYIIKPKDVIALKELLEQICFSNIYISQNTNEKISSEFSIEKMVANHLNLLK